VEKAQRIELGLPALCSQVILYLRVVHARTLTFRLPHLGRDLNLQLRGAQINRYAIALG